MYKKKDVLWRSIKCRGAEHASSAFKPTTLYTLLLSTTDELYKKGLYLLVGDSAYEVFVDRWEPLLQTRLALSIHVVPAGIRFSRKMNLPVKAKLL